MLLPLGGIGVGVVDDAKAKRQLPAHGHQHPLTTPLIPNNVLLPGLENLFPQQTSSQLNNYLRRAITLVENWVNLYQVEASSNVSVGQQLH